MLVAGGASAVAFAPSASAGFVPHCGSSKFIDYIEVQDYPNGQFKIKVHPGANARQDSAFALNPRDAVVDEWHAVQACVSGLYGGLADSIWQQLDCHQKLAYFPNPADADPSFWGTGDTYDLESWHPAISDPTLGKEAFKRCLNSLGESPGDPIGSPYRPDDGVTDLAPAYENVG